MTDLNLKILNKNIMLDLIGDDLVMINKFQIDFLEQARESLKKIIILYNQEVFSEVKEAAHFLKTSAAAVGAEQTAHLLALLENAADVEDKIQCKTLIFKIEKTLLLVRRAVAIDS